jgi:hypothetical protein
VANDGWVAGPVKAVSRGGGRRPAFTGPATQPYSATEVDGWQQLSRVSQKPGRSTPETGARHESGPRSCGSGDKSRAGILDPIANLPARRGPDTITGRVLVVGHGNSIYTNRFNCRRSVMELGGSRGRKLAYVSRSRLRCGARALRIALYRFHISMTWLCKGMRLWI